MIAYYARKEKNTQMSTVPADTSDVWISVVNIDEADIAYLVERHGYSELILRDAQDPFEVPRVEFEDGVTYFFTRYPLPEGGDDSTAPLLIAISNGHVLTVAPNEPQFLHHLRTGVSDILTTDATNFFIHLMRMVEVSFARSLTTIRKEVNRTRVSINDITSKDIERFVVLEGVVNAFTSTLVPTSTALETVLSGKWLQLHEDDKDFVEDLAIATRQTTESAKMVGKTIENIRSANSVILSNRLNKTLETLTSLTVILTIPMAIASIYGMNVPLPFAEEPQAFWVVLGTIMCASGFAAYTLMHGRRP